MAFDHVKIRAPLLIGQEKNDPRVAIATSDAMVAALRKAKHEAAYVVYSDEGHGFNRPENKLDFYVCVEEFLAKYLGGRRGTVEENQRFDGRVTMRPACNQFCF